MFMREGALLRRSTCVLYNHLLPITQSTGGLSLPFTNRFHRPQLLRRSATFHRWLANPRFTPSHRVHQSPFAPQGSHHTITLSIRQHFSFDSNYCIFDLPLRNTKNSGESSSNTIRILCHCRLCLEFPSLFQQRLCRNIPPLSVCSPPSRHRRPTMCHPSMVSYPTNCRWKSFQIHTITSGRALFGIYRL